MEDGGDVKLKYEYAKWMIRYDRTLFNTFEKELANKCCKYKEVLENPPTHGNPPDPTTTIPCSWFLLDICYEAGTTNTFFGANVGLYRLYGDHDNDGIINKDDQDYDDAINRIGDHDGDGVPNNIDPDWKKWFIQKGDHDNDGIANDDDQDWLDLQVRFPGLSWEGVLNHMDEYYGSDWEDRFEDGDLDISGGQEWSDFVDNFSAAFDSIGDFFGGIGNWFDDIWDDFNDWWDWFTGPGCPDFKVGSDNGTHTAHEELDGRGAVTCDWFYVPVDCDGNINWFGSMLCPTCNIQDLDDPQQKKYYMIQDFIKKNGLEFYSSWFDDIKKFDCNPFVPAFAFDECINKKWLEMVSKETGIPVGTCTNIDPLFAVFILEKYQQQKGNETMCDLYNEFSKLSAVRPDNPVTHYDVINCVKPNQNLGDTYSITLSVDDPTNGSTGSSGSTSGPNAGHAFITLQQYSSIGSGSSMSNLVAQYSVGFYPACSKYISLSSVCDGQLGNDSNHPVDASWTFTINYDSYLKVLQNLYLNSKPAWGISYNCTNFAKKSLADAGINAPFPDSIFPHELALYLNSHDPQTVTGLTGCYKSSFQFSAPPNKCK